MIVGSRRQRSWLERDGEGAWRLGVACFFLCWILAVGWNKGKIL